MIRSDHILGDMSSGHLLVVLSISSFPVVLPIPAVCSKGCSILDIQTHTQHGSLSPNPVEFNLESQCESIAAFWEGEYEIQYVDFHIPQPSITWKAEVSSNVLQCHPVSSNVLL